MRHPKPSVQKEAAWAVSNIAAGPCQQIQQLITCGLLAPLVDLLRNVCRNWCFAGVLNVFCPRGVAYKMFWLEFDGLLLKLGTKWGQLYKQPLLGLLEMLHFQFAKVYFNMLCQIFEVIIWKSYTQGYTEFCLLQEFLTVSNVCSYHNLTLRIAAMAVWFCIGLLMFVNAAIWGS